MKITEALVAEHTIFLGVFSQIERVLPRLTTASEVGAMASVIEGMLQRHAEAEKNLAYLALDHALAHQGELERMHQDHHEIDERLRSVQSAGSVAEARRLLDAALLASREHFQGEERTIFPLLEKVLQHDTLSALGHTWLQRNIEAPGRFSPAPLPAGSA